MSSSSQFSAYFFRWNTLASFTVLLLFWQSAIAQQGSECLACHTGLPATEANVIPPERESDEGNVSACNYTDADLFGGWGWNPITRESCPPVADDPPQPASACDYSNADIFDGWGWDPVARKSCPPEEEEDPHAEFPICSAAFYDADGDGFGWENEESCIITAASEPPPVFTNLESGIQVDLIRAYWDGNTDLANRIVQCDLYYFDSYWNEYRKKPVPFRAGAAINNRVFPSYRFHHLALPPEAPYFGWIADVSLVDGNQITPAIFGTVPNWTTDDGRYIGPTVLQSPYLEKVTKADGSIAIRTWHERRFDSALNLQFSGNRVQNDGFFECWDISGRDLEPTGTMGDSTSSPSVLSDLVFTSEPSKFQQDPETIIPLSDEYSSIELTKAYWNYNKDLAGKTVECESYQYDSALEESYFGLGILETYHFPYHFTNSGSRLYYWESELAERGESFIIEDNVLKNPDGSDLYFASIFTSDYVEVTGSTTRFWTSSDQFSECVGITPSGSAPTQVDRNQCDYSSAGLYNGWGWNPVARQSCPPQQHAVPPPSLSSGCDYSNAVRNDGWGWNPATMQSCPPVSDSSNNGGNSTIAQNDSCDYSQSDRQNGWGWNSVTMQSCPPR